MKNRKRFNTIWILILVLALCASLFPAKNILAEDPALTDAASSTESVALEETEEAVVLEETKPLEEAEAAENSEGTETPEVTETPAPDETPEVAETPAPDETPEVTETPAPEKPVNLHSVTLKYASLAYTGKARTQTESIKVTAIVNDREIQLAKNSDYTVSYKNNTNAGTATVTVKGIGKYSGTIKKNFKITPAKIKTLALKYAVLTYTGKKRTQSSSAIVKAAYGGKTVTLKEGTDYRISYTGDLIGPGPAYLVAKGCGNFTGTIKKLYRIVPKTAAIRSVTPQTRRAVVKWSALPSNADGCQIQYSTTSDFSSDVKSKKITDRTKTSAVITGLTAGKTYYFRLRTYTLVRKTGYYSEWSAVKKTKLKINALSISGSKDGKRTLILDNADKTTDSIQFALWSKKNGQDDLVWIEAKKNTAGRWKASFSAKKFRNAGTFELHAYSGEKFLTKTTFTIDPSETETKNTKLAASLKAAKKNDQLIFVGATGTECTVTMLNKNADGTWFELLTTNGNVGSNGIGEVTEWNRKTPVGVYGFTEAFGINEDPGTVLPYTQVDDTYYWVDDVDSAYYNQFVTTKTTPWAWNSAEHIIDYTNSYQYCLALDFNKEGVSGAGSAIFLHVGSGNPTLGCIGVPLAKMKKIMQFVRPGCKIIIDAPEKLKNY